jgi:acyl-CoA thioester hydrolase
VKIKVYYADTDAGGVVYYANYLRWLEMARSELVEDLAESVADYASRGIIFAVVRVEIDYRAPAVLGDEVEIETEVERVRHVRFTLAHRIVRCRDGAELAAANITLACVDPRAKVQTLPKGLSASLRLRMR